MNAPWPRVRAPDSVTGFILVSCVTIEAVLVLSDLGIIGPPRLRLIAYAYGGFWPGLLADWIPNYPAQPALMFVTYSFLHGGVVHLAVNMITLLSLGGEVHDRLGTARYAVTYTVSILGGALAFGVLAPDLRPMVGASGALFGLAGAILVLEAIARHRETLSQGPILRAVLLLVALNVVLWWAMGGHLAWQTHLGGFVAGAVCAWVLRPDDIV